MKALIFNSGLGNRMGELTRSQHKSMARLADGETIFGRQLRLLAAAGVTDVVVTTGPYVEQLEAVAAQFPWIDVTFVPNDRYAETNYIYSMHLAREYLDDDILMLHGDLVFNRRVLDAILADARPDLGAVNAELPLPDKDFKARLDGETITEISVAIHDDECVAFQPLYKLSAPTVAAWLARVAAFVDAGNTGVYAENALNEILGEVSIRAFSYAGHFVNEIDTPEDHATHAEALRRWDVEEQVILTGDEACIRIPELLAQVHARRPLVVSGRTFDGSVVQSALDEHGICYSRFSGYSPNPKLPEVLSGLARYREDGCDSIIAVGGGSAIDVAKCLTILASAGTETFPPFGAPIQRKVPQICVPTTAGTGSESTHFAVVYIDGEKHSIAHDAVLPDYVILAPGLLRTLPAYHKKASLLDALAQCVESIWSRAATPDSKDYAQRGIRLILENFFAYVRKDVEFDPEVTARMQLAANLSGRAINLTKTTAAHAMSYGLTSHYGLAHGHAAALCLRAVWSHYVDLTEDDGADAPDLDRLRTSLREINDAFGVRTSNQALMKFDAILTTLDLPPTIDVDVLVAGVNAERMGNSPVPMSRDEIRRAYEFALGLRPTPEAARLPDDVAGRGEKIDRRALSELQALELDIFEQFDRLCSERGLRYYLSEGSLLGAVRHAGFVPWDDDIDVMMPRADFDRFTSLVEDGVLPDHLHLDSFRTNPKHWTIGAKLQMTEPTKFVQPEVAHVSAHPGPHIDIFMVDPVEQVTGRKFDVQAYALRGLRRALFMSSGRSRELRVNLKARLPIYVIAKLVGSRSLQKWIVYMQTGFNSRPDSAHWGNLCSYYPASTEVFPKEWFGQGRRVPFETVSAVIPDRAEDMLEQIFGPDYMEIPMPAETRGEHNFYVRSTAPSRSDR